MRETRIAVVMNGGISLAVWMGGVTHELNRVRLAGTDFNPSDRLERAVHLAWQAILLQAESRVVVDSVAGTSAGGLNGALLATAVARGGDLAGLRETWLERASLESGKLLRADPRNAPTLLDGDFFADEINAAIEGIASSDQLAQECTLFVTSTAIGKSLAPMVLEGGRTGFYTDSRRVFQFRRELAVDGSELQNDFVSASAPRKPGAPSGPLARAARASASFPVAFAPLEEDQALRAFRSPEIPAVGRGWLMDGGVLDNAPFEPLIAALRQRAVGAPFERVLLYVVPSAAARAQTELGTERRPDAGEVLGGFARAIREPDQRLDVQLLSDSFRRMSSNNSSPHAFLARLLHDPAADRDGLEKAALTLLDTYQVGRAEAFYRSLMAVGSPEVDLRRPDAIFCDLSDIPVVPRTLNPGSPWQWGSSTAERVLRWLGRAAVQIASETPEDDDDARREAFAEIQRSQRATRQFMTELNWKVETQVEASDDFGARLEAYTTAHQDMSQSDPLGGAVRAAAGKIADWLGTNADDLVAAALQLEVVRSAFAWGGEESDVPRFTYLQVSPAARSLVDVPLLTMLPGDTGYDDQNQEWASRKLYGERWGHFGAFATRAGREHDWLWGRLDGASALIEMLLGPDGTTSNLATALTDAILQAEDSSRDQIAAGAVKVSDLTGGTLLDQVLAEQGGEDRRELILRTIPEVLGEVSALPWQAERLARVLLAGIEAVLDAGEFVEATMARVRRPIRGAWRGRPFTDH